MESVRITVDDGADLNQVAIKLGAAGLTRIQVNQEARTITGQVPMGQRGGLSLVPGVEMVAGPHQMHGAAVEPARVGVIIAVTDEAQENCEIEWVAEKLMAAGLKDININDMVGVITGTIEADKIASLSGINGVARVDEEVTSTTAQKTP